MKLQYARIAFTMLLFSTTVFAEETIEVTDESINLESTSASVQQKNNGIWSKIKDTLSLTWQSTGYELYIPLNTYHNRRYYTKDKIDSYNEKAWGLGIGKYRFDDDGDWHAIYAIAFLDSHSDVEPVVGYGFQKTKWITDNFRLGAGFTTGLTIRNESNYMPIPVIAPLLSAEYKKLAVQATYIPGGNGNGNVLFTWLRWQIQ